MFFLTRASFNGAGRLNNFDASNAIRVIAINDPINVYISMKVELMKISIQSSLDVNLRVCIVT